MDNIAINFSDVARARSQLRLQGLSRGIKRKRPLSSHRHRQGALPQRKILKKRQRVISGTRAPVRKIVVHYIRLRWGGCHHRALQRAGQD